MRYAVSPAPEDPTTADCVPVPFASIPLDIPHPSACCTESVEPEGILSTCALDCGYAACKIASAKIRASADGLVIPSGLDQIPYKRARADLYAYASMLESRPGLALCASKAAAAGGQIVEISLGGGVSKKGALGHIEAAHLYLSCALDPDEPYVIDADRPTCTGAGNIPELELTDAE